MSDGFRLTEILTTSSAVANYLGARTVEARHVLSAIGIVRGTLTLDDLGRPQSPMVSRVTGAGTEVEGGVKALAKDWFDKLGNDPMAELDPEQLEAFAAELERLS